MMDNAYRKILLRLSLHRAHQISSKEARHKQNHENYNRKKSAAKLVKGSRWMTIIKVHLKKIIFS